MRVIGWDPCLSANGAQTGNNPQANAKPGDRSGSFVSAGARLELAKADGTVHGSNLNARKQYAETNQQMLDRRSWDQPPTILACDAIVSRNATTLDAGEA
jgi:hypothetical protein